jgi:hypothetical protein
VKGYIRKSLVLFAMRDYTKAIEAIQEAEEHDTEHKHRTEIQQQELKCQQALFSQRTTETQEETLERAMRDPEVAVSHSIANAVKIYIYICNVSPHKGHHERPCDSADTAAGSRKPRGAPRSLEESHRSPEDTEADQCRYHQDEVGRVVRWKLTFGLSAKCEVKVCPL